MNRKEKLDTLLTELESKYPMDEKGKAYIAPYLKLVYKPSFPEDQLEKTISLIKEVYKRSYEVCQADRASQEGIKKIAKNLHTMSEYVGKLGEGMCKIIETSGKICEKAPEILKTIENTNRSLEQIKEAVDTNTLVTKKQKKMLDKVAEDLLIENQTKPDYTPTNPKKLN